MRNRATTPLSKAKVRQSWSKYNLYNLNRLRTPPTIGRTFFQQKWAAKSIARNYHGEQIRESQWTRMFSKRLRSVVPMSTLKLAQDDGSEASAGRGSGLLAAGVREETQSFARKTPYTHMTFAPLERRLDVAVFRAMFASSARQARQFVLHGAVTVNGRKMRYPGYLLNPGDMFQVDPERVMFATGAPKTKEERREARLERRKAAEAKEAEAAEEEGAEAKEEQAESEAQKEEEIDPKETLKGLLSQAKNIMSRDKDVLPAKRKQELRGFQKSIRRVMSRRTGQDALTDNLEAQFDELMTRLKAIKIQEKKQDKEESASTAPKKSEDTEADAASASDDDKPTEALSEAFRQASQNPEGSVDTSKLTEDEFETLKRALVQMRDNPIDSSKPYATPWRPRDYMGAFAFIPRYLEVNHNVCAAVYLRHPVARPGFAEVPTPFGEQIATPAFAWYLRRR
ncbi:mitochondrial 37S ribosomal protein uS4m [Aspergillus undulatus]|uniref:mitochondrial 37S ribosomal protein uS4m n=1 Tax=Aspergillus undulatus TaxID=1810928 RepID=UPI003CCD1142